MTRRHVGPPLAHCGPAGPKLFRWFFPDGQPARALRWEYFHRRTAAKALAEGWRLRVYLKNGQFVDVRGRGFGRD